MANTRIVELAPGIVGIRGWLVWNYLLYDETGVVCLDTGIAMHGARIKSWFAQTGRKPCDLKAIILTHGHVDHVGCTAELQKWSGAPVYLHSADHDLAMGRYRGPWPSRLLSSIERSSNMMWWIRRMSIDRELEDEQTLPYWGGLQVVSVPGHTMGHVALYSPAKRLLFAADSFLSRGSRVFFPSRTMNIDDRLARTSVLKLADLDVDWVYPAHHQGLKHNLIEDLRRYAVSKRAFVSTP